MAVTKREQQIIDAHEAGLSDRQIAAQLGLSFNYVKTRRNALCTGDGANGRHIGMMRLDSSKLLNSIMSARTGA